MTSGEDRRSLGKSLTRVVRPLREFLTLGVRYRKAGDASRKCLAVCAFFLMLSVFSGGVVYAYFDKVKDKELQTLECLDLKHSHLDYSDKEKGEADCNGAVSMKLKDGTSQREIFNGIGVLRGRVKNGGEWARSFDDAPFEGRSVSLSERAKYWLIPILSFLVSKLIGSVLHTYTELRYSNESGVSMERLLLSRLFEDPLYAFFGERMRDNPLRLRVGKDDSSSEASPPQSETPTSEVGALSRPADGSEQRAAGRESTPGGDPPQVAPPRSPAKHTIHNRSGPGNSSHTGVFEKCKRLWRPLIWGFLYFVAVNGVELFANFASQGRERNVNPVGGGNYTMEIAPMYKKLSGEDEKVKFVGFRKCSQFRIEIEGVIGPDDDDDSSMNGGNRGYVNSLMSCGTYYEPETSSSPGPSRLDKRGVCTWRNGFDEDRIEIYLGNSLCNSSDSRRGNLNIRFRARDYGNELDGSENPVFKAVGVSLTSNPFSSRPKADPQVSFDLDSTAQGNLVASLADVVQEFNSNKRRVDENTGLLRELGQIPDTAAIELTEAISQNIFFYSKYSFQNRTNDYCESNKDECLRVSLGRTRTRRAFVWAAIAPIVVAILVKVIAWCTMQSFYIREISPIFEDALFSSLHERSATGYSGAFKECAEVRGLPFPKFIRVQRGFFGNEELNRYRYRYVVYEDQYAEEASYRTVVATGVAATNGDADIAPPQQEQEPLQGHATSGDADIEPAQRKIVVEPLVDHDMPENMPDGTFY